MSPGWTKQEVAEGMSAEIAIANVRNYPKTADFLNY
jgi:hypothetical protein